MCVISERNLNVFEVRSASGKNDTPQEIVGIFGWNLEPNILDYLLNTGLNDLYKLATFNLTFGIYGEHQAVIDVVIVCICTGIFELHLFGIGLFHLQRGDVFGDVVTTQRDNGQVTENVFVVNGDRSALCSEVNQHATGPLFGLAQHAICQHHRGKIHLGDGYTGLIETFVEVAIEGFMPQNVEEIAFQTVALYADRVELILLVEFVFLCGCL